MKLTPPEIRAVFDAAHEVPPLRCGGLEIVPMESVFAGRRWGFRFAVVQRRDTDRCLTTFDPRIHDPSGVRSFIARFQHVATQVCAHPDRPLRELIPRERAVLRRFWHLLGRARLRGRDRR